MNKDLVTVIIPAYNVEKYIARGIESVLHQTYRFFELIIVDDGSTDNTSKIIEGYAHEDKRINYLKQENSGVSAARNKALGLANGKYILFLDSDDWLELDTIEYLLSLVNSREDIIVSSGCYFANMNSKGEIEKVNCTDIKINECVTSEQALLTIGTPKYRLSSSCYKLFPVKILKKYNIYFDETIHNAEDGLFTFQCLKHVEQFYYSSEPKWNILTRPGSATTSPFNIKKLTALKALNIMLDDKTNSATLNDTIKKYYTIWCLQLLSECFNYQEPLYDEINNLRRNVKSIPTKYWPKALKQKMRLIVFTYFPKKHIYTFEKIRKK